MTVSSLIIYSTKLPLSRQEIRRYLDKPFDVPKFSCHIQSTERAVNLVTEAAVAGQEARDGFV